MKKFALVLCFTILLILYKTVSVYADYISPGDLLDCYIDTIPPSGKYPVVIQPGGAVELWLITQNSMNYPNFNISAKNLNTGIVRNIPFTSTSPATNTGIDLGVYDDPGIYEVKATSHVGNDICVLNSAFSVKDPSSSLKLDDPKSPITEEITTIPIIAISGLEPGKKYHIKLINWKGADLDADQVNGNNSGSQEWPANASGQVAALSVCNNGQAHRDDCSEIFGNQTYGMDIYEVGGPYIGPLSFDVDSTLGGGGGGGPSLGKNPCIDSNGDGKADYCPTAIGNIPTNLGDFASAVLRIALGISGGIVLILMVIGSIRVMTSSGDPQRVAAGREMIIAAIAGALFIAFSVMIMQFLGTAIVPIPGLTFGT